MRTAVFLLLACAAWGQSLNPQQLFQQAVEAQQRGDNALAVERYRKLLSLHADSLEVRANLGAALSSLGRFDEAIGEYRVAIAKSPENPALRLNLALAFYKKDSFREAARELERLHRAAPTDARVATLLGDCYTRLHEDERAVEILKPIGVAHPDDLAIAWLLGSALIRTSHNREGLELVERVAREGNRAEAYLLAGQTALKMNEFERARDDADAALRADTKTPGALTLRGTALTYLGDNAAAIAALRSALDADPGDFEGHLALGAVLNTERDLDGARQHLEQAVKLRPDSNLALYELARLKRSQGETEAAVRDLEKVVRADPSWAQPHLELAALYFRLQRTADGEHEKAIFDRLNAGQKK